MGWADDLSNSMGLNVTPVYGGGYGSSYGSGGYGSGDAAAISAAIDRAREEADREYDLRKQQSKQQYQASMMSARTAADAQRATAKYQQQQYELARDRLAFDREVQAQEFGLKERRFGLEQAGLGYQVLNMAANLRGPENYFQAANFARGAANDPNTSTFLQALKGNTRLPDFGAQYGVPDPETLATLSSKLGTQLGPGAGTTTAGNANDTYLNNIRGLYAAGAHRLGAGALENLTPTEQGLLTSGIDAIGGDAKTFMDQYRRSRIGQGLAGSAAA